MTGKSQTSTIGLENQFNRLITQKDYLEAYKLLIDNPRIIGKLSVDDLAHYSQLFEREVKGYNPNMIMSPLQEIIMGEQK